MFTLDGVRKFHRWTHSCLNLALDHLATIPAEEYVREVAGFGFATVHQQVIHIFNCEGSWIHALQAQPYANRMPADFPDASAARLLQQELSRETQAYLAGLTDRQLNEDMELRFSDGDTAVRTPALVLHHVFTHAFHHKGQIVAMCRVLGHPAPDTDLNQFD